jgi:hypothetical protein
VLRLISPSLTTHTAHCGKCHAALPEKVWVTTLRNVSAVPVSGRLGVLFFVLVGGLVLSQNYFSLEWPSAPAPEVQLCVAETPLTIGGILRVYDTSEPSPVLTKWTINAGNGADYFVKIVDAQTDLPKASYFVHGGSASTTDVPIGAFVVKHASRRRWCGERQLFGPDTIIQKGTKGVVFLEDHVYTLYLTPQRNGNFPTTNISRNEF